jgi:hypothetical protein
MLVSSMGLDRDIQSTEKATRLFSRGVTQSALAVMIFGTPILRPILSGLILFLDALSACAKSEPERMNINKHS